MQHAGTAPRKLMDAPQDSPSKRLDLLAGEGSAQTEHSTFCLPNTCHA